MSDEQVRTKVARANPDECGCGPSDEEARALWPSVTMGRRSAIALGALGAAALGAFGLSAGVSAAYAADYPSWDDVQKAKNNEAAKGREITRIEGLISALGRRVANANAAAERAGDEYIQAQDAYQEAYEYAEQLQAQADEQAELADGSARQAAQVASQLYRSGGDDTSLALFFAGSATTADNLLARLGQMDKLLEHNRTVYDTAVSARNSAQQLSDQAVVARDRRDELKKEAEAKLIKAQEAAAAAEAALAEQESHLGTLEAQLAALKDTTAKTIVGYQAGVAERKRIEEERKKAEAERRRREAEEAAKNAANNNNGGGGGGSGSGSSAPGPGGWARPHGGRITYWYGPRAPMCGSSGCTTGYHRGIDFANGCGAHIYAAAAGTIHTRAYSSIFGNFIRIDHGGGVITLYAHIRDGGFLVSHGQRVSAGQAIAYAGNTGKSFGCHLHFEVTVNGPKVNPATFLRDRGVSV